jgi:predicted site-specific integrase-resolvase
MQHQSPRPAPSTASFLRSAQVAEILQVSPKIIARWGHAGRIPYQSTLGGHYHSPADVIHQLVASPLVEVCDG